MGMKEFCDHLYDDSTDGYIQILKLNDVFVAPNTMYIPKRKVENIRQFRSLFQDIDCKNLGLAKAETVYLIWELYHEGKIPKPTMVTDSGRGIHFYWRIQNTPYGALNTWQELQDYIYYNLKHLGADRQATDSARVLRLPGTINSKNQVNCKVLYSRA